VCSMTRLVYANGYSRNTGLLPRPHPGDSLTRLLRERSRARANVLQGRFAEVAVLTLAALPLLVTACGGTTESVSRDVCLSGTRWVGGSSSDPERSPGTDCLQCHIENDGPPLVAAGTVYAVADNTRQIENDCFGLEGVAVEIEGADGRLFQTTTNRAGNF